MEICTTKQQDKSSLWRWTDKELIGPCTQPQSKLTSKTGANFKSSIWYAHNLQTQLLKQQIRQGKTCFHVKKKCNDLFLDVLVPGAGSIKQGERIYLLRADAYRIWS